MALSTDRPPITQFKTPRLRLVWRPAADTRASWKAGIVGFYFRENPRRLHIVFAARGILLWGLGLAVAGYLAAAAGLHYAWSRSPHNRVTFLDILLPTRWEQTKHKRGVDLVARGVEELRGQRFGTALMFLARGVNMAPADQRGRLELSRLYIRAGYLHRAKKLLQDGLAYPPIPKAYTDLFFALESYMEDHEAILGAVDALAKSDDSRIRRDALVQKANALRQLERWAELDALRDSLAATPLIGVELAWARAQLERGTPERALAAIERAPDLFGLLDERADIESRLALAAGDIERAQRVHDTWRKARPTDARPRVLEVLIAIRANQWLAAREAIENYLLHFGTQPQQAAQIIIRLAEESDEQWVRFARQVAEESGAYSPALRMVFIETLLVRGHFIEAERELAAANAVIQATKFRAGSWPQGVQRIIQAARGTSPSARGLLIDFLTSERASPAGYHLALNALAASPAREALTDVYAAAMNRYPSLQPKPATREKIEIAMRAGPAARTLGARVTTDAATNPTPRVELPVRKERLATPLPTSQRDQARKDAEQFPTERVARTGIARAEQLASEGQYQASLDLLAQIERAGHPTLRREILLTRARNHGELRQFEQLTATLRLLMRETPLNQVQLRQLAEHWRATGRTDSALILHREIVANIPAALWAAEMQRQFTDELKIQPPEPQA